MNKEKVIWGVIAAFLVVCSGYLVFGKIRSEDQLGFSNLNVSNAVAGSGTTNQIAYFDGTTSIAGDTSFTINAGSDTVTVTNLTVSGTCTGCGGSGGTGAQVSGTLTTGNIIIAQNTSTVGFVTGFNLTTSTSAFYLPGGYTMFATNTSMAFGTSTSMFAWQTASGTLTNLFNLNVSGTIDTASGTNLTCGGQDCQKMLSLSAAGGWPSYTNGVATATKFEVGTNRTNIWLSGFYPAGDTYQEWSTPLPNDYDGGTMNCIFFWQSTSTPTFNGVTWGIQGQAVADAGAWGAAWGATSTVTMIDGNAANTMNVTTATTMTLAGTPTGAKFAQFRVSRSTANASDTSTSTAALQAVECSYGVNKLTAIVL